jgi:CRP/FNR family transcriptional regulator, cyclic AMP receptor protein
MTSTGATLPAAPRKFLASLTGAERGSLEELGIRRRFPARTMLMFEYEPCERVMVLLHGRVKVTQTTDDGRELLLSICDQGDLLGELGFVDSQPRIASVTALEPVEALVISAAVFRAYLGRTPRLTGLLLELITCRCRETARKRAQLAALDTMGRLAACILELAERYGEPISDGLAIAMPISQDELTSWTAASRAGVAQALQTMRNLHWIVTERRRMIVRDPAALRSRAA